MVRPLKAISPVVATTLLIIIAVVTAVALYLWVSGTVTSQPTQQAKLQESIKIDSVAIDTANNQVIVYVRNTGNVKVSVDAIYVLDALTGKQVCEANTSINTPLDVGETTKITVNTCNFTDVKAILVKAVTSDGVEATYIAAVPTS